MKTQGYFIIAFFGVAALVSGFTYVNEILKQLGISEEDAAYYIYGNFEKGELSHPTSDLIKSLIPEKRAAVVNGLGAYIKKYTASASFNEQYLNDRENAKPENAKDKLAKELIEVKKNRAEMQEAMKGATGDMKTLAEATLKMLDEQQQSLENPDNPQTPLYIAGLLGTAILNEEEYQAALAKFEQDYPATANGMLKKRLQQFLDLTATINFDIKVVKRGDQMVFEDPALEAKSYHWKLCYRSGRETIHAARQFAQQWITELK